MKEIETRENIKDKTDKTAEAQDFVEKDADGQSAVGKMKYGKFADAEGLLFAYENLEREFTKKSQRLKELEQILSRDNEADSPRVNEADNRQADPTEISAAAAGNPEDTSDGDTAEKLLDDKDFLENYIFANKDITREVMRRYVDEISRNSVPSTINSRSGKMSLTPPKKPRTIKEASKMAEKFFDK